MTPCVRFKLRTTLGDPPTAAQVRILAALDGAARALDTELTVTSGRDSHGPTDPHTRGHALDCRTSNLSAEQVKILQDVCKRTLGSDFTVLHETSDTPGATAAHLHIQVRKGVAQWPQDEVAGPSV